MRACLYLWLLACPVRKGRGTAMLEYALGLIFMGMMMITVTWVVTRLLPDYYYRGLLPTIVNATP